jgi:hypothetical protein
MAEFAALTLNGEILTIDEVDLEVYPLGEHERSAWIDRRRLTFWGVDRPFDASRLCYHRAESRWYVGGRFLDPTAEHPADEPARPPVLFEIPRAGAEDLYRFATGGRELPRPGGRSRHDEIVARLRKKPKQRRLVEFMAHRAAATFDEIAREMYGDPNTEDGTIRTIVSRTNDSLREIRAPFEFDSSNSTITKIFPG